MQKCSYYQINSIVKVFKLIELLVTKRQFTLGELCRLCKYPKTTVHRMLLTLESLGYVEQNPTNKCYLASLKLFSLGGQIVHNLDLIETTKPLLSELSQETGETVNLGVLDNDDIICIYKVESKHHLKIDQPIGYKVKAYYTAMGKAALAFLPIEQRTRLLSEHPISPYTFNSLKTVAAIEEDLQKVRQLGYATDNEEGSIGVRCVGASVFDRNLEVVAGISIAGPTSRVKEEDFEYLAKLVMKTAALVSIRLGAQKDTLSKLGKWLEEVLDESIVIEEKVPLGSDV